MPSKPDLLKSLPQNPPEFAWPQNPVSGDLATTENLPVLGEDVPVIGPVMKINLLCKPRGSIPFGTSSNKYFVARPAPPKKFFKSCSVSFSSKISPVDKFTRKIRPIYPNI